MIPQSRTERMEWGAILLSAIFISAATFFQACAHRASPNSLAPDELSCGSSPGAIPGSCGDRATTTSRRCVLCTGGRACVTSLGEYCVGDGACADPLCKKVEE